MEDLKTHFLLRYSSDYDCMYEENETPIATGKSSVCENKVTSWVKGLPMCTTVPFPAPHVRNLVDTFLESAKKADYLGLGSIPWNNDGA